MQERSRQPADNFKSKALPQPHGALVGAHHKIKLHRAKSPLLGNAQRMRAHGSRYAAAKRPRRGHVSAIRDVRATALLICAQIIRGKNFAIFFRDKHRVARRVPIRQRLLARHVRRQSVRVAATNHRLEYFPNRVAVVCRCRANLHLVQPGSRVPVSCCNAPCFSAQSTNPWGAFFTPKIFAFFTLAMCSQRTSRKSAFVIPASARLASVRSAPARSAPVRSLSSRLAPWNETCSKLPLRKLVERKLAFEKSAAGNLPSRTSAAEKFARNKRALSSRTPCKNAPETSTPTSGTWSAFNSCKASIRPPLPP